MPPEVPEILPDGWHWNEAELTRQHQLNDCLVTLVVTHGPRMSLIGTGFIISARQRFAVAVTAAHCFDQIRKEIGPIPRFNPSTPPEFRPKPTALELERVKAIYMTRGIVSVCNVEMGLWDGPSDKAIFTMRAPQTIPDLFQKEVLLDDDVPQEGEHVVMLGYGEIEVTFTPMGENKGRSDIWRRLVMRVGRVEGAKSTLLRGPNLQTSIAIYSGMSGGLVARLGEPTGPIKAFGFVSHAPEPQPLQDRSQSGHSVAGILPMERHVRADGTQVVSMNIVATDTGGRVPAELIPPQPGRDAPTQ